LADKAKKQFKQETIERPIDADVMKDKFPVVGNEIVQDLIKN
jgi:hypothetical protein